MLDVKWDPHEIKCSRCNGAARRCCSGGIVMAQEAAIPGGCAYE